MENRLGRGLSYSLSQAKNKYECLKTGKPIQVGEYHFVNHSGKRYSVDAFTELYPERAKDCGCKPHPKCKPSKAQVKNRAATKPKAKRQTKTKRKVSANLHYLFVASLASVRQLKVFSFFFKKNMFDSNQSEAIRRALSS